MAEQATFVVKRTRKHSPYRILKDSSIDVVVRPPDLKRQTLMTMNDIPSGPLHYLVPPTSPPLPSSQVLLPNSEYVVSSPNQFALVTPPSNPTPHHTTGTNVVDLTEESEDDVIDLTSTTPTLGRQPFSFDPRPSCRYATVPVAPSPDVMLLGSTGNNHHTTPIKRSSRKLKSKGSHNIIPPSSVVLLESQTPPNGKDLSTIKCPVCLETMPQFQKNGSKLVSTICGHIFCSQCLRNSITTMHKCPTCRRKLTLKQYHQLFL